MDDSGTRYPLKYANGTGDLTNGPYFIAAYSVYVFIPDYAIDTLDGVPGNLAGSGYAYNRIAGFDPVSASGQSSYGAGLEPGYCDPATNPYATNPMVSGCAVMPNNTASDDIVQAQISISPPWNQAPGGTKYYVNPNTSIWAGGSPTYGVLPGMTNYHDGLGLREPTQNIMNSVTFTYGGEIGFKDPANCDIFDNSTQRLIPATAQYPGAPAGTYAWFNPAGSTAGYPGSVASFWTFEYGHYDLSAVNPVYNSANVGLAGVIDSAVFAGSDTYNTTDGRYWGKWTAQANAVNGCRTSAPSGGWFSDPNSVPGGIDAVNAVRIRAVDPNVVDGFTAATTAVGRNWRFMLQARDTFNGGPNDGAVIPTGTVLANYESAWATNVSNGTPAGPTATIYTPAPENTTTSGDRVTLVRGQVNIKKNTVTVGGVGSGAAAIDATGSANAGDTVVWQIQPSGSSLSTGASASAVKIVDVLPAYTTYDATCTATIAGGTVPALVEPNTPAAGQTRLTWNLGDLAYNVSWPTLRVCTRTDPTAPTGTALVNTATVSTPSALPASDPHTVNLTQTAQVAIAKYVDNSLDVLNDAQVYTLRARNFSQLVSVKNFRFIEVLPYNGDSTNTANVVRNPGSTYSGTLTLTGVPTTAFSNNPTKPAVPGTFYYTADAPGSVNQDWNANTSTWCTYSGTTFTLALGTGSCPASLAAVTAFMFVATPDLAATTVSSGYQSVMDVMFTVQAFGDKPNEWFANRFTGFTPTILNGTGPNAPQQVLQSNRVEVGTYAFYVGDWVFIDRNGNSKYDAGDTPAPDGTIVQLWNPGADGVVGGADDSLIATTSTLGGKYLFTDLYAGQVYASIPAYEFTTGGHLVGWTADPTVGAEDQNDSVSQDGVLAGDGSVVSSVHTLSYTVLAGFPTGQEPQADNTHALLLPARALDMFTNLTIDFGFTGFGSIGDTVWFDADGNGSLDPSETGIAGATVTVTWFGPDGVAGGGDDIVYTTTTDANGKYLVASLPAGSYAVAVAGANLTPTFDADGTGTANTASVSLTQGQARTDVDFGYAATLTLGDRIFTDVDRDGLYNPAIDTAVPDGTVVVLHRADGTVVGTATTVGGLYTFTGLVPGDYYVEIPASQFAAGAALEGWTQTTAVADPNTDINNDSNGIGHVDGSVATGMITLTATFDPATRTAVGGEPSGLTNNTLDIGLIKPVHPAITVVKTVNGQDANVAPGPNVTSGTPVTWSYAVTNTGDIGLMTVVLSDDILGDVTGKYASGDTNSNHVLDVGETWLYSVSGVAADGLHTNIATVTGTPTATGTSALPGTTPVSASDPANYTGISPAFTFKKFTNDVDADTATGPLVAVGSSVTWTYAVINTGNVALTTVVTDDKVPAADIDCGQGTGNSLALAVGATVICKAVGTATAGQYANTGTAVSTAPATVDSSGTTIPGAVLTKADPSHYFGAAPAITVVKSINGDDANTAPGVGVTTPGTMVFTFLVTNTGNVALNPVTVTDSDLAAADIICPSTVLTAGASMTCTASSAAPAAGVSHANTATATGTPPVMTDGTVIPDVADTDDAHAYGIPAPSVTITKFINELDVNTAPGTEVVTGDTVNVSFLVTNTGNTRLNPVVVSDDTIPASSITCPATTLDPAASMTCTATFIAPAPLTQHTNTGTVTGTPVYADNVRMIDPVTGAAIPAVTDTDPANAVAVQPGVYVVKKINGQDANSAPGTLVVPGSTMTVTFYVANIGSTPLNPVVVTDDTIPAASIVCPATSLAVGASMTCTATYLAPAAGSQHTDIATSTATAIVNGQPLTTPVTSTDPANALGADPKLSIIKSINGLDANTIMTGASVNPGDIMSITFLVTNTGNTTMVNVGVTDSLVPTGAISCPASTLAVGASMTCTATWVAPAVGGPHMNTGTVTGTPTQVDGLPIIDPATNTPVGPSTSTDIAYAYTPAHPAVTVVKSINGADANTAPGVAVVAGSDMAVTFLVTNTGDVTLSPVTVTDTDAAVISCPKTVLAPSESMTCTTILSAPQAGGTHTDTATVSGQAVQIDGVTPALGADGLPLAPVTATDPANAYTPAHPAVTVVKSINGADANTTPGVSVPAGTDMAVTFLVTNTGDVTLNPVVVTDSVATTITCPAVSLAAGASMTCTATIPAPQAGGTHTDTATVAGTPVLADGTIPALGADGLPLAPVTATDPANAYTPAHPAVTVVKSINGADANTTPGVSVPAGTDMAVTFLVTNTGDVTLNPVVVTDSVATTITCPAVSLAAGASMTCTATIPAPQAGGTHTDTATVAGTPVLADGTIPALGADGLPLAPVTATDPANAYTPSADGSGGVIETGVIGDPSVTLWLLLVGLVLMAAAAGVLRRARA